MCGGERVLDLRKRDASSSKMEVASITVCVPVYNAEKYLEECLDSLYSQDYSSYDIILIDDGSTDRSGDICDWYKEKHPDKTTVIHKQNEGPLLARSVAFSRAQGDYVMCVDSDDKLYAGALAAVASVISATNADIIRFGYSRNQEYVIPNSASSVCYAAEEKALVLQRLCQATDGSENPMCFKAIRRSCVGVDFDFSSFKGLKFAEDFLQTVVAFDRASTFCYVDVPLYYYRPGSGITRNYKPHFYTDVQKCLNVAERFASNWESRYECKGLKSGIDACRLDSSAQYALWLAEANDHGGLRMLSSSEAFRGCANDRDALRLLRLDRAFVVMALSYNWHFVLRLIAGLRRFK